jgi:hypothetical protein
MPYFKVYWVATVGETIVKAENEKEARDIIYKSKRGDEAIASEEFWDDYQPCLSDDVEELTPEELKAYDIS